MRIEAYATKTPVRALMTLMSLVTAFAFCVANPVVTCGQERPDVHQSKSPAPPGLLDSANAVVDPDRDYRVGPGDVIEIQIVRAPELSGTYRVNANGTIIMQYLGRLMAERKTPEELVSMISDGLRGRYLKNPQVTATVKQINSHAFFIQGAVNKPGVYQMEGRPSLLKLITVAGGLAANHGSVAFIIREVRQPSGVTTEDLESDVPTASTRASRVKASPALTAGSDTELSEEFDLIKVNINGLFKGNFDQNMYVEPGSIIHLPRADVFFVAGEVHAPGSFPLKEGTTLRQAISLAQGTTFKASTGSGIIFREDPANGKRQEIKVDVGAIMSGRKEDISIIANDIIMVPNSRMKSVGGALLSAVGFSAIRTVRIPTR